MTTYIKLLYSVCLRVAYGKVVKFDPRGGVLKGILNQSAIILYVVGLNYLILDW